MSTFDAGPEVIKMTHLIKKIEKKDEVESIVCVTVQHRKVIDQVSETFNVKPMIICLDYEIM